MISCNDNWLLLTRRPRVSTSSCDVVEVGVQSVPRESIWQRGDLLPASCCGTVLGYFRVPNIIDIRHQIVDPWEVHVLMQQDALRAVNLVECKNICLMDCDDVFQVRELDVVEKCRAESDTGGLREAVFLLDVAAVHVLRNVCDSLCSCRLIIGVAAHSSDGTTGL